MRTASAALLSLLVAGSAWGQAIPIGPNGRAMVTDAPSFDSPTIDAFARQRVSNPITLFDSKQLHDAQPLFWDDQEVSGGGTTSAHSTAKAETVIGVADTTAGKRVRQTFMRFNYQPGKSMLVFMTGTLGSSGGGTGITRAAGMFDDDNGIFFLDDEGTIKSCIRSSTSGSPVDTCVAQSSWNLDPLDGTGPSGVTLDATKSQILFFDFEWLGVGRVRTGFVVDGAPIYVHEHNHANSVSNVYMSTPNNPLRYEIENDGTGAASTLSHICATVITEGGAQRTGQLRATSTGGTHVDANTANAIYAIIGIRLKSTHLDAVIDLVDFSVINQQAQDFEWMLVLNPTVAGTFTYSAEGNSAVETATGATANTITAPNGTTAGQVIASGMVKSTNQGGGAISTSLDNAIRLGSAIDGTRDEIVLAVRPLAASADIEASLNWRELQ